MTHIEQLTRYTANFIDELILNGVEQVVISPGSRSTPLAILFTAHKEIREWIVVDERSAAYFALGMAKQTKKPVALVCTSGTAAANYLPAIVEASYTRVPLVVLTADRPHELRDVGASQTMNQLNMFGNYVKQFYEMALPSSEPEMLDYVRRRAVMGVYDATGENPGPVQFNFPFREPLVPDLELPNLWGSSNSSQANWLLAGDQQLDMSFTRYLADMISGKKKGLFVCGPHTNDKLAEEITRLADKLHIPILADPLSQLRSGQHALGNLITGYDAILRDKQVRDGLRPDYIIRFGAMPISKSYLFFLQENPDCLHITVENKAGMREPTNRASGFIFADEVQLCKAMMNVVDAPTETDDWLETWRAYEEISKRAIESHVTDALSEGEAVRQVLIHTPEASHVFIGNSMPVRDLDTFFTPLAKEVIIHGNRGVSGIDGITSSALGVAATANGRTSLIIGDVSFYHDLNGLLIAKQYGLNMTIVLINNDGGGIFSFLPQAKAAGEFEKLFGTPHNLAFEQVVSMYGGTFETVTSVNSYEKALEKSYLTDGITVIEVKTDRAENVQLHQTLWTNIREEILQYDK